MIATVVDAGPGKITGIRSRQLGCCVPPTSPLQTSVLHHFPRGCPMPAVRLTEYLLRWEQHYDAGRDVPAAELCPGEPALAAEVQRAIDALKCGRLTDIASLL